MSLLIDALKKAEEEKKKTAEQADTKQPNLLEQSNALPQIEAAKSEPQTSEKPGLSEPPATELTPAPLLSKAEGYQREQPDQAAPTDKTQSLEIEEFDLDGIQDLTFETVPQVLPPEDKEATIPSKRTIKSSLKEYFERSQSLEQRRIEESTPGGIQDSTLESGPQVPLPEDKKATLPSERAIKSSPKDYFEVSKSLERTRVNMSKERAIPRAVADTTATRVSAQTVFTAGRRPLSSRSPMLGMVAVIVLAASLGAIWLNLHFSTPVARDMEIPVVSPKVEKSLVTTEPKPPAIPAIAPLSAPEPTANPPAATVSEEVTPEPLPIEETPEPAVAVVESPAAADIKSPATEESVSEPEVYELAEEEAVFFAPAPTAKPQVKSAPLVVAQADQGAPHFQSPGITMPLVEPSAIKITRSVSRDITNAKVIEAYRAFRTGNYPQAESSYRLVLSQHPDNRDVLLGLAAIAMRKGKTEEAYQLYRRLLRLNPRDSVASAALLNLQGAASREITESQIKLLLDQEPNAPYLYFSLGNFYARQARWNEAQQAYFRAYTHDKRNPDYVFNLAVSLDRLGQGKTALTYYRQALEMADQESVNFNTSQVLTRIQALSNVVGANRS